MLSGTPRSKGLSVPVEKRKYWLLTAMNTLNASMPANPRQNGTVSNRQPTAMTAMTAPFCEGFAGIEAFCAFLAVATHKVCQPRQESLFERNAAS